MIEMMGKYLEKPEAGRVLFVSHTKAAARTAVERWGGEDRRLDIQTLHSFCFKTLGMSRAQTADDYKVRGLLEQYGLDADTGGDGSGYLDVYSLAQSMLIPVEEAYDRSARPGSREHFLSFTRAYDGWKKHYGFRDFGDMLLGYLEVKQPSGHRLLVVDEAQDCTPLHWKVVEHIIALDPQITVIVAGDDDQCIYSYSGADPLGPRRFIEKHDAVVRVLNQSYRVPKTVHGVAERIATRIKGRIPKEYQPAPREGRAALRGDLSTIMYDVQPSTDTLILYSDRFVREEVEHELQDAATPYVAFSGMPSPFEHRAAMAMRIAATSNEEDPQWPNLQPTIKRGLNERAAKVWDTVGPEPVIEKLRKGDLGQLSYPEKFDDYYQRVDWKAKPRVQISTIHGAKGHEADNVHLVNGQSQAALDHNQVDPDASHRLFYVAVTRARENLYIYEGNNGYPVPVGQ